MSNFLHGANVHANGVRQHYLRYGGARTDRDPIILLPGITSPAITWGFVGEQLGHAFDVYILDVRGRGLSEASTDLDYSLDAQAKDVIAFAEALSLSTYAIVGHSMGARIAIRAARSHPAGLTRLVLIDPPVSGPGRRPYPANLAWYVDSMAAALAAPASMPCAASVRPGRTSNCACGRNGCTLAMSARCWKASKGFTPTIFTATYRMWPSRRA